MKRSPPHFRDADGSVAIAVGIVVLCAALSSVLPQLRSNTWIFRDGRFYVNVATTLVEDFTLDQHAFAASWYSGTLGWNRNLDPGWSNVALGARGEYFPKHPWIHPLIFSPFYFAFGLPGTLAWNLLMFGVIAAGLYSFARAYASPASAAGAVALFVMGTALRESAYDVSVDVLMLACMAQALAAIGAGRGALAGVLVAVCVVIKPTALMLLPSLSLLLFERRDRAGLLRSLGSGTAVLALYAAINTWMYGRPWWSGYNRTLVTRNGEPVVADHLDAFSVPFDEGFARMWSGSYGLSHTFTALGLAVPGLAAFARVRPRYALAAILAATLSLLVFARYQYEGHRFHWPAAAFLVPALAVSIELAGELARRLGALATWATNAARELASRPADRERGRIVAAGETPGARAAAAVLGGAAITLFFGAPLGARLAPSRPVIDALSVALGESAAEGLALLGHLSLAAMLIASLVSLVARVSTPAIAAIAIAGVSLLPEVRDAVIAGGPWLLVASVLAVATERAARSWSGLSIGLAASAALAALWISDRESAQHLAQSLEEPCLFRAFWPWALAAAPGWVLAWRDDPRTGVALAVLGSVGWIALLGAAPPSALGAILVAPGAAVIAEAARRVIAQRSWTPRELGLAVALMLVALLSIGSFRRAVAAAQPFRIASERGLRTAAVRWGDVPCDFLAWEHLSWECSTFDQGGLFGLTGLAVSEGIVVGGERRELFWIPIARSGQPRTVSWADVEPGRELVLRWAVPDSLAGGVTLEVRVDGRVIHQLDVPGRGDAQLHEVRIPTPELAERDSVRLTLRVTQAGRLGGLAGVAVDGGWR